MPNDISTIDRTFPDLSGEEGLEAKVTRLTDWAFKLYESLRYTLYNLGADNFNETELHLITSPILARIEDADKNVAELRVQADLISASLANAEGDIAALQVQADGISASLANAEGDIAALRVQANGISASVSSLDGRVSGLEVGMDGVVFFSHLTDGVTQISGSNIKTGVISAINIRTYFVSQQQGSDGAYEMYINQNDTTPTAKIELEWRAVPWVNISYATTHYLNNYQACFTSNYYRNNPVDAVVFTYGGHALLGAHNGNAYLYGKTGVYLFSNNNVIINSDEIVQITAYGVSPFGNYGIHLANNTAISGDIYLSGNIYRNGQIIL
jgi:hypothetical protein